VCQYQDGNVYDSAVHDTTGNLANHFLPVHYSEEGVHGDVHGYFNNAVVGRGVDSTSATLTVH